MPDESVMLAAIIERLSPVEREAVLHYLCDRSVPLLVRDESGAYHLKGTGSLLRIGTALLLVTAKHVMRDDGTDFTLYCPSGPNANDRHELVGQRRFPYAQLERGRLELDVGVLRIQPTLASRFHDWKPLVLEDVLWSREEATLPTRDTFVFCGFPVEWVRVDRDPQALSRRLIFHINAFKGSIDGFASFDSRVHTLYNGSVDGYNLDARKTQPMPRLNGVSGSSIWNWTPITKPSGLWSPTSELRVVSVETSVDASAARRWIKAVNWPVVIQTIWDFSPDLRSDIEQVMGVPKHCSK